MFTSYQDREGAARVFSALGDPTPIFQLFSGDAPYTIVWSEADNQDFSLATFLQTPGEVAFVNLAVVSDREKHLQLREKLFAKIFILTFVKIDFTPPPLNIDEKPLRFRGPVLEVTSG